MIPSSPTPRFAPFSPARLPAVLVVAFMMSPAACSPTDTGEDLRCGEGTVRVDNVCVGDEPSDTSTPSDADVSSDSTAPAPTDTAAEPDGGLSLDGEAGVDGRDTPDDGHTADGDASEVVDATTITIPAGESRRIEIGDDDTLENTIIDVTADGAEAQIVAIGEGWTIRNVAFRGTVDTGFEDGGEQHSMMDLAGTGVVEHCYLGDGVADDVRRGGITFRSGEHDGHVVIRDCYIAGWSDNAVYSAGLARPDSADGTVGIENSYFRDNNVAHLRMAADGSYASGCVVHNTGNVPPGNTHVHSKGVYTGYGDDSQRVTIDDCQIAITDANTNGRNDAFNSPPNEWDSSTDSEIYVTGTEHDGTSIGNVTFGPDNGNDPDLTPPPNVPQSPRDALR